MAAAMVLASAPTAQAEHARCPKKARKASRLSKNQATLTKQAWKDVEVRHYRRATKRFRRAVRSFSANAPAWHGLGRSLLYQGKYTLAEAPLKCALRLDDSDPGVYLDLIAVLKKTHQKRRAKKLRRKMKRRHPKADPRKIAAHIPKDLVRTVYFD